MINIDQRKKFNVIVDCLERYKDQHGILPTLDEILDLPEIIQLFPENTQAKFRKFSIEILHNEHIFKDIYSKRCKL